MKLHQKNQKQKRKSPLGICCLFRNNHNKSEQITVRKENIYSKHIEQSIGSMSIDKIDETIIEEWQRNLARTSLKTSSKKVIQNELSAMLRFAYKRKFIKRLPMIDAIVADTPDEEKKKFLTKEQFDTLCDHIQRNYDESLYAMVQLLYYSGLRIGEALVITTKDLNGNVLYINKTFSSATNKINRTKNGKNRYVVLSDKIVELLKGREQYYRQCGMENDLYYFGGVKPFSYKNIGYYYEKACRELNIEPSNLHSLRHSHVSNLIKLGFNSFEISERTGHSPKMIESTYGHILDDPQTKMAKMLEKL